MSPRAAIGFEPAHVERFLELWVRSPFHDLSQRLTVVSEAAQAWPLARGWNGVSIRIPAGATSLRLEASSAVSARALPGGSTDACGRGALCRGCTPTRAATITSRANSVTRWRTWRRCSGARPSSSRCPSSSASTSKAPATSSRPASTAPGTTARAWKAPNTEAPFTLETLDEWGAFFDDAAELVNCSIGEPFMGKDIESLLDAFGERGKMLEITINGQILTDGHIAKLLGRNMHLYISFDAATAATYARLRNGRFDQLVANVRRLIAAKGGPGRLPLVYLVFMPMPANLHEVDAFVRLAADLKPDRMVLRPLNDGSATRPEVGSCRLSLRLPERDPAVRRAGSRQRQGRRAVRASRRAPCRSDGFRRLDRSQLPRGLRRAAGARR